MRSVSAEKEEEALLRQTAESQLYTIKLEVINEKKTWDEAKTKFEASLKEVETRLSEARCQNKILHSQMATLAETVEKFQSKRIVSFASMKDDEELEKGILGSDEDVAGLQKIISELREVVKFMRSERDLYEAQLEAARRTAERERAASAVAKHSLDEARNEVQVLQNQGVSGYKENEKLADERKADLSKSRAAEEQLTLLRESNVLLREDSEKLRKDLLATQKELEDAKKLLEPAEVKCRDLGVDKAALEAEKASLMREVDAWKRRVQSLISKFNQVCTWFIVTFLS